jgi:hypothetical protein
LPLAKKGIASILQRRILVACLADMLIILTLFKPWFVDWGYYCLTSFPWDISGAGGWYNNMVWVNNII